MHRRQQPNPFKSLELDSKVENIRDFDEQLPRPFRDTDGGIAGAQGWVSVLSLCFSFSACF